MKSRKEQSRPFSGVLELDSPSASNLISRQFSPSDCARLAYSYSVVANDSALNELKIIRSPKIRFNPLPARIIYILMVEGRCRDLEVLDASVLACADAQLSSLKYIASLDKNRILEAPYLAAFTLDLLRHLHMSKDEVEPDLKAQLLAINELAESGAFSFWPKINSLISSALSRCRKSIRA